MLVKGHRWVTLQNLYPTKIATEPTCETVRGRTETQCNGHRSFMHDIPYMVSKQPRDVRRTGTRWGQDFIENGNANWTLNWQLRLSGARGNGETKEYGNERRRLPSTAVRLHRCTAYQILATTMRTSVTIGFDHRTSGRRNRHARQRTKDSQAESQSGCIKSRSKPLEHIQSSGRECGRGAPTWVCTRQPICQEHEACTWEFPSAM